MSDHPDIIKLVKIVFDDQNVEKRLWSCLGQTCSGSLIVFLSHFIVIFLQICGCFWRIHLAKTCDESTVWVDILCSAAGCILPSPNLLKSYFLQKTALLSLVGPNDSGKTYLIHQWLKFGTLQPKFDKIYFFSQHPQPLYHVMQTQIDNLEFVRGVHFEFINPLKNNGSKYLLFFDHSCAEICNSKEFVDIATAGRHHVFGTK